MTTPPEGSKKPRFFSRLFGGGKASAPAPDPAPETPAIADMTETATDFI
jgi:hypothetical protein